MTDAVKNTKMTREEFIKKYALGPGGTFLADDKGGNAASEVAGRNVAQYYDDYLGPNAVTTRRMGWDGDNAPIQWGHGRMPDGSIKTLDAWSYVDPHPESTSKSGWEQFLDVARPAAGLAALYFGGQYLLGDGLFGAGSTTGVGATGATASPVVGGTAGVGTSSLAPLGGEAFTPLSLGQMSAPLSAGEMASLGASGSSSGLLGSIGQWAKDNPMLTKLAGAALGAATSGDSKKSESSTRDPWAPAQPYLLQNLAQNQAMSDYYNANPFSQEQKNAYQGLLNTVAQSQAGGQGLLGNAANFMNSRRGVLPTMTATPQNVTAPAVDWSQYANIGRR